MKKMFEKNECTFAIILIVIYVVGSSVMLRVSDAIGVKFLAETIFNTILSTIILVFIIKNQLQKHVGLCKSQVSATKMLLYVPLPVIAMVATFFGIGTEFTAAQLVLRTLMMINVGFLEEVIFRGFLFRGIAKDSVKEAVIISSVTFGIGHIVNLLNGYDILKNVIQIVFAVAVGFMLVFIFLRTGSIISCIIFHAFNNSISAVSNAQHLIDALGSKEAADLLTAGIGIVIALLYTIYIVKVIPKRELTDM
ncbi:MAG: CPBP family intramembrane metalloprotease [Clostridia bacterium]|nr:CPBP family intramembrane metalloprotease [Clostridia bacterium]